MEPSVRSALLPIAEKIGTPQKITGQHPGLALDRFQRFPQSDTKHRDAFLRWVCDTPVPRIYADLYAEWTAALQELPGVATRELDTAGRMIVGLGTESVRETGITLSHLTGAPFIPGSALKGLLRRSCAKRQVTAIDGLHEFLFGEQRSAAYLTIFDAWFVPDPYPQEPLRRETLTIGHPNYNNAEPGNRQPPWDLDDPNPVPFLSAHGRFLFAIQGPDAAGEWARRVLELLATALADEGIGAKTSSGFGRFIMESPVVEGADTQ